MYTSKTTKCGRTLLKLFKLIVNKIQLFSDTRHKNISLKRSWAGSQKHIKKAVRIGTVLQFQRKWPPPTS